MTKEEIVLIDEIKKLKGVTVNPGADGGCVVVYQETENGLKCQSVWLGRSRSVGNLQTILDKSK